MYFMESISFVSAKILPVKTFLTIKVSLGTKLVEMAEKKVGKPAL